MLSTDWFRTTSLTTTVIKKKQVTRTPAFDMEDFLKGHSHVEAYTVFFEHFVPCALKKTEWERRIAMAGTHTTASTDNFLSTVSDEAFALLLLENSYDRWFDLYTSNPEGVMQQRGIKQRRFQSDVPTLYTRGGIKYHKYQIKEGEKKGWSNGGIIRFNELFEMVKRDRTVNSNFEAAWLKARNETQAEEGESVSKRKRTQVAATSELFEEEE